LLILRISALPDAGGSLQGSLRRPRTLRGSAASRPSLQTSTFVAVAPEPSDAPSVPVKTEKEKVQRSRIDWRGGFAALFGSTPASPTVATSPVASVSAKLRPLRLSPSPKPVEEARHRPLPHPSGSAHRISRAEEIEEEEEDRLQLKRVALLQDQLQEEAADQAAVSPTRPARLFSGQRRQSSISSAQSHASSRSISKGESPSGRRGPFDSLVNHLGASDQDSYFPSLASAGVGADQEVTVRWQTTDVPKRLYVD
jgi:hypothetical protein